MDNMKELEAHLKIFKMKCKRKGYNVYDVYPLFCAYYESNKEKYKFKKEVVLNKALDIFLS